MHNVLEPTFDKEGYPTKETLDTIRRWPSDNYPSLFVYLKLAWQYGDEYVSCGKGYWTFHTCGWSGNESIIEAMQDNIMFWTLHWQSSTRGGHYTFNRRHFV